MNLLVSLATLFALASIASPASIASLEVGRSTDAVAGEGDGHARCVHEETPHEEKPCSSKSLGSPAVASAILLATGQGVGIAAGESRRVVR